MNNAKTALGQKILAIKQQRKLSWAGHRRPAGLFADLDLCRMPGTDVDDGSRPRRRPARCSA